MKDCVQKHPNDHGQGYYHQSEKCKCIRRVCIYSLFISFTTFHFCTFIFVHSCYLTFLRGTGDGPLSQYLLVQKQPIRPIFDVIIIEKQASIKSLIHQNTPRACALGVPCCLPPARGKRVLALPVAEKARALFPQRSKNARDGVSPQHFSGTARWTGTACGG